MMLVLGRRAQESIIIGNDIKITILGIHGNQVRMGIAAPHDVQIDREEISKIRLAEKIDGVLENEGNK